MSPEKLGIGIETFRKWVRQEEANQGERDDRLTSKDAEELKRLRRENAELTRTNEILRLASAFSPRRPTRPGAGRDVRGGASSHLRVAPLLAVIGEPVSAFDDRVSRTPSALAVADAAVAERIEAIWERSCRSYGAPRIHAMLAREGLRVGRKRVQLSLGVRGQLVIKAAELSALRVGMFVLDEARAGSSEVLEHTLVPAFEERIPAHQTSPVREA